MNEISRKSPEFASSVKKGLEREQSDMAQVRWVMVAETQGQYRCQAVCSSICHIMYNVIMTGKEVGLGCVSVALL